MNEMVRELFFEDWLKTASTREIVQKLIKNDERYKQIKILNGVINDIERILYDDISNIDCRISIQERIDFFRENGG